MYWVQEIYKQGWIKTSKPIICLEKLRALGFLVYLLFFYFHVYRAQAHISFLFKRCFFLSFLLSWTSFRVQIPTPMVNVLCPFIKKFSPTWGTWRSLVENVQSSIKLLIRVILNWNLENKFGLFGTRNKPFKTEAEGREWPTSLSFTPLSVDSQTSFNTCRT